MGIVYAAYDDELDRKIAIKVVRAERVDELARARVLREAQAMAKLSHPNVVQIYDVGMHGEQVYVAMEFVAGPTLAAWTKVWTEQAAAGGRAAWPEVLAHYVEAGRGLAAAHAVNLVHRDFKPVNAIVGEDGRVRVLDFGIARPINPARVGLVSENPTGPSPVLRLVEGEGDTIASGTGTLTKAGALVGTPAYMSPEQFSGGAVDARSDQFGFCVALWEALHGERPFEGRTPGALLLAMQAAAIRPPPTSGPGSLVPSWLRERIRRGLACEPAARWPSMEALLAALLDDPAHRRRRVGKALVVVGLGVAVVAAAVAFAHMRQVEAEQAEAATAMALAEEAEAQRKALAAEAARDLALADARASASRARDTARILAARSLSRDPTLAAALLREVEDIEAPGWRSAALEVLQRPISRQVLDVHDDRIVDVDYSPDGAWLASASFDGRIRLWSTRALVDDRYYELDAGDRLFELDFDPQGLRIVGASRNATAKLWRLPSEPPQRAGEPLEVERVLRAPDLVWTARFSPQGDRVVAATRAGEVVSWTLDVEARELEPSARVQITAKNVWHAEFSPRGDRVAIASSDGRVMLWAPSSGELVELARHAGDAWVANFSPDGRFVASSSSSGEVRVDAVEPGGASQLLRGHTSSVQRLAWSPDAEYLASASQDHSVRIWPLDASGQLAAAPRKLEFGSTHALVPAFSPDSRWLAVGSVEPTVHVVELAGGRPIELHGHTGDVFALRFSPDGRQLVTSSHDRSLRLWDTDWSRVERAFDARLSLGENRWLVRDGEGGTRLWVLDDAGVRPGPEIAAEVDHEWAAVGRVGPRLAWVVVGSRDDELLGLALADADADAGRLAPRWRIRVPSPPLAIPIDPTGHFVAAVYSEGLRLWHFDRGGLEGRIREVDPEIEFTNDWTLVGFSPDGELLVTASTRGEVVIAEVDAEAGEILARHVQPMRPHGGRANALLFDPAGDYFVMTSLDRSVRVWLEGRLDAPLLELSLPSEARSLTIDVERGEVLLGCNDGVIRRLDPRTGELELVEGHFDGSPLSMANAAGRLVLGTNQGELHVIDGLPDMPRLRLGGGVRRIELSAYDHLIAATDDEVLQVMWLGESLAPAQLQARLVAATDRCPSASERMELAGEPPELAVRGCE